MKRSAKDRSGATLIVTLGILTVLSVMIAGFFISSRIHRQIGASDQHRVTARNQMDETLFLAMRFVEESMMYPNYAGDFRSDDEGDSSVFDNSLNRQRTAPLAQWFTEEYGVTNGFDISNVAFQTEDVLTSPTLAETPTAHVNLLTPQVLRLMPPILTNRVAELVRPDATIPLRSGWHEVEPVPGSDVNFKLLPGANPSRIAFTIINCSSLIDANHFERGPTATKRAALCFSQADVTNWVNDAGAAGAFTNLEGIVDMMSHIFERYFTNTVNTDLTDALCEATLRTDRKSVV